MCSVEPITFIHKCISVCSLGVQSCRTFSCIRITEVNEHGKKATEVQFNRACTDGLVRLLYVPDLPLLNVSPSTTVLLLLTMSNMNSGSLGLLLLFSTWRFPTQAGALIGMWNSLVCKGFSILNVVNWSTRFS